MKTRYDYEIDGVDDEESNGMFDTLIDSFEYCPECEYEGPLTLRKGGYVCPECRTLILPNG